MALETQLKTAEELAWLPDDGFRYELVRGELRKMTPAGEHHRKRLDWLVAGTRMAVLIDPRRRGLAVHRSLREGAMLKEAEYLNADPVVPGWSVPVRDLFA